MKQCSWLREETILSELKGRLTGLGWLFAGGSRVFGAALPGAHSAAAVAHVGQPP